MNNKEIMRAAIREYTIPKLQERGFAGRYPHFRRKMENGIELVCHEVNRQLEDAWVWLVRFEGERS